MFAERSKPLRARFVLAYFFRGINVNNAGGDTEASRPVIAFDFSDHFPFAGSTRDVNCHLAEFVDH
jgi:hypothetical protein